METIKKEEKKADLEQLLNSLIEKGWKPRGHINYKICKYNDMLEKVSFNNKDYIGLGEHSLIELVSKESGLWQFVCENGMVKFKQEVYSKCIIGKQGDANDYKTYSRLEYRLIESSLKDESELEQFLLSNIVIKDE